jgi:hypothetical protein
MASIVGVKLPDEINKSIDLADNALLFYTEHTLGYSESVREPLSQSTMEQRALKESYAWEANRRTASIGEEAMGLLSFILITKSCPGVKLQEYSTMMATGWRSRLYCTVRVCRNASHAVWCN